MNVLLSTIGRRSYIVDYFLAAGASQVIGTTDRHGLDSEFTVGLLSCNRRYIMPPIKSPDYIEAVLELCRKERVNMICSLFDMDCHCLSGHLNEFRKIGVVPFLPGAEVSEICFDKVCTDQFLNGIGVGSPATFLTLEDFFASKVGFPAVVKPRFGFASLNMFFVKNEKELLGCFNPEVHMIQQALKGEEYSFDILNDLEGKVVSCVVKRKLKMRAGETDQAITVKNDRLLSLAVEIGEALGHTGPLDVDLFVSGDGVHILEFNPRFGGGYPLAHAAGARFPELMLEMAKGNLPRSIVGDYREDIVMIKDMRIITGSLAALMDDCRSIG